MNRLLVLILVAGSLVAAGCGYKSYGSRLADTEARIKDQLTLDQVLLPPIGDDFQKLSVYVRGPVGWTYAPVFAPEYAATNPTYEQQIAPYFDLRGSFVGPVAAPSTPGKEQAVAPPAPPVLRILGRRKKEASEAEKAQGAAPEPEVARGDFLTDLRNLLNTFYAGDAANAVPETVSKTIWPRSRPPKSLELERYKFNGSNGQLVHAYVFKQAQGTTEYDLAVIFEFPDGQAPAASNNYVDLALGTLAVGARATSRFAGGTGEEPAESGPGAGPAVAF